jgi:DNA-binding CsgD family transcriptional regulator
VGREAELAEIERFLDAAGESFAALVLVGEPGIGKSTVWREARHRAELRGWRVLRSRPSVAEAKLSFAGVADLLEGVEEQAFDRLPDPQKDALEVALLRTGPSRPAAGPRVVAAGFLTLIRGLAVAQPVLIAVDDWQWLDLSSRRVLEFAARRLEAEQVGLLCSVRTPLAGEPLGTAVTEDRLHALEIGRLSLAALGKMVGSRLGRSMARPLLVRIAQASGGNPFYALEVARLLADRGLDRAAGVDLPVPDDLRFLTLTRIRHLPPAARDAVLLAAVMANPTADVIDLEAIGPAEEAGIVSIDSAGRIEFTHPLFASAAYGSVSTARQRSLHREAAELVSDPEQRARHLALGSERRDATVAAWLDQAAARASSRGATAAAAELALLAAERTPREDQTAAARRMLTSARFHFEAGDLARAESLADRVIGEADAGALKAEAFQLASQLAARRSNFSRASELAVNALEVADDDRTRAGIELDLVYCAVSLGDFAGGQSHAETAAVYADGAGERGMLGDALAVSTMAKFLFGQGLDTLQLAEALKLEDALMSRSWIMRPSVIHGMLQLWTGELDDAVATLDAVHTESIERGVETFAPAASFYRVWAGVWRGELGEARRLADEARAAADLLEDSWALGIALSAVALVHAFDGQPDLARSAGDDSLALFERLQFRSGVVWPLWALGLAELSNQNPAGTDRLLRPLAAQVAAMGAGDPVLMMFLPDEIEALIALGELGLADGYLEPFLQRSYELDRGWAIASAERCRGALAAARGDAHAAAEAFERALAAHERVAMPLERARTLLVSGQASRRFKQRGLARGALEDAFAIFAEHGARLWAENARRELARVGRPGSARAGLTETEQRVAELVASGLSNQEVAERAFLSIKTVEANLTRIYRKLGVGSRVALANALRTGDLERDGETPKT